LRSPFLQSILVFCIVLILSSYLSPNSSDNQAQLHSVLLQFIIVLGLPLTLSRLLHLNPKVVFQLRSTSIKNLLIALTLTLCLIFWLEEINYLQTKFMTRAVNLNDQFRIFLRANSLPQLIWLLLSMAIIPGVCEEFLFRGYILNRLLKQDNRWQAIMISSVLFGVFHQDLSRLLPTTLAGVMLALITIQSGSLYNAIASHILVNAWGILVSNLSFPLHTSWFSSSRYSPWLLHAICIAGIFLAGNLFNKARAGENKTSPCRR
jgi:sodium transport system permease protein